MKEHARVQRPRMSMMNLHECETTRGVRRMHMST
jgi:hypothetical protein